MVEAGQRLSYSIQLEKGEDKGRGKSEVTAVTSPHSCGMAGYVEVLWSGTAISLSILCLVVVLVMAKCWPSKAKAAATGGGRETSDDKRLEMQVKELETRGDLDGAAALLLSAWTKEGSSRAITLAHELSQRYPAQAFQMGCPLQQGNRVSDLAPSREQEHDAGCAVDDTTPATPAVSTDDAVAPNTGAAPERVSGENDEQGSPSAVLTTENSSSGGGDAIAVAEVAPSASRKRNGDDERDGGGSGGDAPSPTAPATNTATTTTPWERGWQGPEGFKPPPSSSSSNPTPTPSPHFGTTSLSSPKREAEEGALGCEQAVFLRNFTVSQLNAFDGGAPAPVVRGGVVKAKKARPIYIALRGEVYDASAGRHLYGPGGAYSEFPGHDISRRVARGIKGTASTGTGSAALDDLSLEGLDRFEKMTVRGWEDTFKARGYPRVGRVVTPPPPRLFLRAELRAFDGRSASEAASEAAGRGGRTGEEAGVGEERKEGAGAEGGEGEESVPVPVPMPAGYATRPIYMGVRDKVFDVSFGGSEFYVDGGPYECLAGRDASRVLAKMSMKPEDIEGVLDYASLNHREEKNLADWVGKLGEGEGGRGYPIVGYLMELETVYKDRDMMRGPNKRLKRSSVGLSGRQAGGQQFVTDENSVLLRSKEDILQRWARFLGVLLNTKCPALNPDVVEQVEQ